MNRTSPTPRHARAFTLLELIVAMAVLTVLTSIAGVAYLSVVDRSSGTGLEVSAATSAMLVQRRAATTSQPVSKDLVDAMLADQDPSRDGVQTRDGIEYDAVITDDATRTVIFQQGQHSVTAVWGLGVADGPTVTTTANTQADAAH